MSTCKCGQPTFNCNCHFTHEEPFTYEDRLKLEAEVEKRGTRMAMVADWWEEEKVLREQAEAKAEAMQKANNNLREALERIENYPKGDVWVTAKTCRKIALQALKEVTHGVNK